MSRLFFTDRIYLSPAIKCQKCYHLNNPAGMNVLYAELTPTRCVLIFMEDLAVNIDNTNIICQIKYNSHLIKPVCREQYFN